MKVRNLKNNRTMLTALRGLILLVILATMLSLAVQLAVNRQDGTATQEAAEAGNAVWNNEDLFVLAARQNPGAFRPLAVTMYVAVAIVLPGIEPNIRDVGDGLWYCFALVTTIGLGDYTAATIPGRILSVILGLYGIVVVALVTSVIVNLYNETRNTADPEDRKDAGENSETAV